MHVTITTSYVLVFYLIRPHTHACSLNIQCYAPVICNHGAESRDFDVSLCKARVYALHCGDNLMVKVLPKALLKSRQASTCEITPAGFAMELKAPQFHGTAGTILSSKHDT